MTPASWRQLEDLYLAAAEREPGLRSAFIAPVAGDDEKLRAKVGSMLARDRSENGVHDRAPDGGLADFTESAPTQLGPYRVERLLAEGGWARFTRLAIRRCVSPAFVHRSKSEP